MSLIKRTLLGFLLASSLGTLASCTDEKEPKPPVESDDDDSDDSDDFEDADDDSSGAMIDAGGRSDAGKKDAGKADAGKADGGKGTTTMRGMDASIDEEDAGSAKPQPGEVTTGPGTSTVTTTEGATIYLDKDCPPVISTARNNPRFQGCCLPSGQCGATGYGVKDLTVAFQCRTYEDPALANWVIATSIPDEVKSCTIPAQP